MWILGNWSWSSSSGKTAWCGPMSGIQSKPSSPGEESPSAQALLWRASESKWEKHSKGECYLNLLVTSVEHLPTSAFSQFNTCIYLMKWALLCSSDGIQMLRKVQWPSWVPKATGGRTKIYTQVSDSHLASFLCLSPPTQLTATCLQSLRTTHWPSAFQISPRTGPRTTFWTARTQKWHLFFVVYPKKCF